MMKSREDKRVGNLYLVATPIGNLSDITYRAVEILKSVKVIYAEDTRVSQRITGRYFVKTDLRIFNEFSSSNVYEDIGVLLRDGYDVAVVTDAGTPGISDPGQRLVGYVRKTINNANIIAIPGPSAVTAALSISGVNTDQFTFLGFVPHKKGRQTFFRNLSKIEARPVVFYESPHRIIKTLEALGDILGRDARLILMRELTKIYEEVYDRSIEEIIIAIKGEKERGEFVLIVP